MAEDAGAADTVTFIVLISLLLAIPGIVIPGLTKIFVDDYLIAGHSSWLRPLVAVFIATVGVLWLLSVMQQRTLLRLEMRLGVSTAASWSGIFSICLLSFSPSAMPETSWSASRPTGGLRV